MTTITLKNGRFYIAGSFSMGTKHAVTQKLIEHGATISETLSVRQVDCLIAGRRCKNKYNQAKSRNIPIIEEDQLLVLLETGQVDAVETHVFDIEFDINAAIEQLRGLFDGAPTSQTWTAILEIIDTVRSATNGDLAQLHLPRRRVLVPNPHHATMDTTEKPQVIRRCQRV